MTHAEKLTALLSLTEALARALDRSHSLVRQHEERAAAQELRAARAGEVAGFFQPLHEAARRAAARVRRLRAQTQRAEAGAGRFRWVGGEERAFCAAWEQLCRGYVADLLHAHERPVERALWRRWCAPAAPGGRPDGEGEAEEPAPPWEEVWGGYLGALNGFAERVRAFAKRHLDLEE